MSNTVDKETPANDQEDIRKFEVGDLAVYPAHGVGRIEAIESKVVNGETHDFYIMKIIENGMVIMIPTWNVKAVGLRDVISKEEIPKIIEVMKAKRESGIDNQTWNRRYREYLNKIQTGDPIEVAKVLRDLALLRQDKNLSFGERKMYDQARSLLVQEVSVAKDTDEKTVEAEIEAMFNA